MSETGTPLLLDAVEIGPVAHGGHCVARHQGRVIFVRHALPGELVRVAVTDTSHDRFWRGDAVDVIQASPDRVTPPCPVAGPGMCGGCDLQHASLPAQRRLKAAVVAEQLHRLAGLDWAGEVETVSTPASTDGLGWRTRMRYVTDAAGRLGLRAHRSHRVVPLPAGGCRIAAPGGGDLELAGWPAEAEVLTVAAASGPVLVVADEPRPDPVVRERAVGREFAVAVHGFWQVHPAAADTLAAAVLDGLRPRAGERAFDLYCGVGLLTAALADRGCRVWGVEADRAAVDLARDNVTGARFTAGRVERVLARLPERTDLVVLDPPRTGAGRRVLSAAVARRPRAVAYVACDPAALARDLGVAAELGYRSVSIRAFDVFPMTHHVECVAILTPAQPS